MKKIGMFLLMVLAAMPNSKAGLVAHWKFDETSSSTNFTSDRLDSGPNELTLDNLSGTYTRGDAGLNGNALMTRRDTSFPGMRVSSLSNSSSLLKPSGSFSFSLFVDPFVNDTKVSILTVGGSYGLELLGGATPKFNFYVLSATSSASVTGSIIPTEVWDGTGGIGDDLNNNVHWYHLAGSYNDASGELSLYVDGIKYTTTLAGGGAPKTSTSDFYVGERAAIVPGMLGLYDDLQFYDQSFSDEDVAFLGANPGLTIPEPGTLGLFTISSVGLLLGRRLFSN